MVGDPDKLGRWGHSYYERIGVTKSVTCLVAEQAGESSEPEGLERTVPIVSRSSGTLSINIKILSQLLEPINTLVQLFRSISLIAGIICDYQSYQTINKLLIHKGIYHRHPSRRIFGFG